MTQIEIVTINEPFSSPGEAEALGLFGLIELVMNGYGFSGDETEKLKQFNQEYGKAGKTMFFVKDSKSVVASLVLRPIDDFLDKKTINVSGIVVSPEYRGKGLASILFKSAVQKLEPELFVGHTKSPSAVLSRTSSLSKLGFITFYGLTNVTPNYVEEISVPFLDQYVYLKRVEANKDYVLTVSTDLLPPSVPAVENFPSLIQNAFKPVIEKQKKLGNSATAVMPLISVLN